MKHWLIILVLLSGTAFGQFFDDSGFGDLHEGSYFSESSEGWTLASNATAAESSYFSESNDYWGAWDNPPDYGEDAGGNPGTRVPVDAGILWLILAGSAVGVLALFQRKKKLLPGKTVREDV